MNKERRERERASERARERPGGGGNQEEGLRLKQLH